MAGGGSLSSRMLGAALLDVGTYEEVEADPSATGQAAAVVVLVSLCAGIGAVDGGGFASGLQATLALTYWGIWAGVVYVVGDLLLGGTATWGEVLRTTGFAQAPRVFLVLGLVPLVGGVVTIVVWVWTLATGFVAVRQALDLGNVKTLVTVIIAWLLTVASTIVLGIVMAMAGVGLLPGSPLT